jgi:hypothetical protein
MPHLLLMDYQLMGWVVLGNVALFGIPTIAIWLWRRRKRRRAPRAAQLDDSLAMSYRRAFTYLLMAFGWLLVVWGVLFLLSALLELVKPSSGSGSSPAVGFFLGAALCFAGGLLMIRFFRSILRKGPNAHV